MAAKKDMVDDALPPVPDLAEKDKKEDNKKEDKKEDKEPAPAPAPAKKRGRPAGSTKAKVAVGLGGSLAIRLGLEYTVGGKMIVIDREAQLAVGAEPTTAAAEKLQGWLDQFEAQLKK